MTTDNQSIQYSHLEEAHTALDLTTQERDLYNRHLDNLWGKGGVDNPDGTRSSLYTVGFEDNGRHYNVPSVYDGKILDTGVAVDRAHTEGLAKFPSYGSSKEADERGDLLHHFMEKDTNVYEQVMERAKTPATELRPLQKKGLQAVQNQNTIEDPNKGKPLSDTDLNMLNQMSPEDFNALRDKTKGAISDHPILQTWPHKLVDAILHTGYTALKGTYGIATGQIDPHSPEAIQSVTEGAGLVIGGAGGISTAVGTDATHGAFLSFAKSPGLNSDRMLKAISMEEEGATAKEIFLKTGAEKYEGKWGQRVPYSDTEIRLKPDKVDLYDAGPKGTSIKNGAVDQYTVKGTTTLDRVMTHQELFKADPSLKNVPIRSMTQDEVMMYPSVHGFTDKDATFIAIRPGLNEEAFKSSLVHEVEHIVQSRHGFPGGSSSESFKDKAYYSLENTFNQQRGNIDNKLWALHDKNVPITLPKTHSDNVVPEMATIAIKGKYTPNRLTDEEKVVYRDILKYDLSKDLEGLRWTQNQLGIKQRENEIKYLNTKGEVGARVGEQELKLTKHEARDQSYIDAMEKMVPEKLRVDSPHDPGIIQASQDFGSVYRHEGHYITPDQAQRLYTAKPELRPIPPGFSQDNIKSMNAKQYLGLVDYLKKDYTYNQWRRQGGNDNFPSNPQLEALIKKLGIK